MKINKQQRNEHKCKKESQKLMITLNMEPMELDCDVDGTIDKQN